MGQVTAVNVLVEVMMLVAKFIKEGWHDLVLIVWAQKIVREAATGDFRGDLGTGPTVARRAANASDIRTCRSVAMVCERFLYPHFLRR